MKKNSWILLIILLAGAFLRFSGLNWGLPYPFHPDERNMAVAITRFSSKSLNPEFFAYGQFPLYLAYFSSQILSFWLPGKIKEILSFNQAVLFLRFWSAFFSTATIYVAYLIAQKLSSKRLFTVDCSLLTATAVAFTPGLIQAAHFGTTESILTFSFLAITYFSLNILEKPSLKNFFWAAFFLGIAFGSKISAAVFCTPLALAILYQLIKLKPAKEKLMLFFKLIFTLTLTLTLTLFTSPYLLLAKNDSVGTLFYEISVAQGKSLPFYTRQFFETTPILFQMQKIFPYALGWPIFILGTFGILGSLFSIIRKIISKKELTFFDFALCTLHFALFAYFIPNAFLFTRWTRFMTPIFPFFSIFSIFFISLLVTASHESFKEKLKQKSFKFLIVIFSFSFLILNLWPGIIFSSIYFKPDIRFVASDWIYTHIPSGSQVIFDTANVVDIPVPPPKPRAEARSEGGPTPDYHLSLISFNFYDLDQVPQLYEQLLNYLETSDYIFVPSRRVFMNHLRFPEKYPLVTKYYQLLFSGQLGFQEIKKFSPFPNFSLLTFNFSLVDERSEETFTVFDHPVIRIYQKDIYYTKKEYESLLKNEEHN